MKKVHNLELPAAFADDVYSGHKPFDIRDADGGFQAGDYIIYRVVDKSGAHVEHAVEDRRFKITYVFSGGGIKEGYVIIGIKHSGSVKKMRERAKKS